MRRRVASAAKPNPAHFAIAKLENALQRRRLCGPDPTPCAKPSSTRSRGLAAWRLTYAFRVSDRMRL